MVIPGGGTFQAKATLSAKALRQKHIHLAPLRTAVGDGSVTGLELRKATGNKMTENLAIRSKILSFTLIWKTTGRF